MINFMKKLYIRSKGFVSYYFISVLMIIISIVVINCQIIYYKLSILDLIKDYHDKQYNIIYMLSYVNKHLDSIEDGIYEVNNVSFEILIDENIIYLNDFNDDISYELVIEDNHIIDYYLR